MKFSSCRLIVLLALLGIAPQCQSSSTSGKKITKADLEGQVMVQWEGKRNLSRPDLLVPIKRAIVSKDNKQFNLNLKSRGSVQTWTFTQVLKTRLRVKGSKITGFQENGGSYRFYYIERNGKPAIAEYTLIKDSSFVSGTIGKNLDLQLSFKKIRVKDANGKTYAQRMPAKLKLIAELKPEWI